jgi:hypothetical protein
MELDGVLAELSDVQDRLLALPGDAFAERYPLLQRRDELRAKAAELRGDRDRDADRTSEDLIRELRALREQRATVEKQRINLVSQTGGGGAPGEGGMAGLGGVQINAAISGAQGLGSIQARIDRIAGILVNRGVEMPD